MTFEAENAVLKKLGLDLRAARLGLLRDGRLVRVRGRALRRLGRRRRAGAAAGRARGRRRHAGHRRRLQLPRADRRPDRPRARCTWRRCSRWRCTKARTARPAARPRRRTSRSASGSRSPRSRRSRPSRASGSSWASAWLMLCPAAPPRARAVRRGRTRRWTNRQQRRSAVAQVRRGPGLRPARRRRPRTQADAIDEDATRSAPRRPASAGWLRRPARAGPSRGRVYHRLQALWTGPGVPVVGPTRSGLKGRSTLRDRP